MRNLMLMCTYLFLLFIVSCKKDDPVVNDPGQTITSDYLNLKVGNYWVYDHYKIDSLGNEIKTQYQDSVAITRDTMINNKVYYVLEGITMAGSQWRTLAYLRDSLKCLVDADGTVLFSETNFHDTLNKVVAYANYPDTIYYLYTIMENPAQLINVPAGTFQALNAKAYLTLYYSNLSQGNEIYHKDLNRFFGKGVGEILSTWAFFSEYYHSGCYYERRLSRYFLMN